LAGVGAASSGHPGSGIDFPPTLESYGDAEAVFGIWGIPLFYTIVVFYDRATAVAGAVTGGGLTVIANAPNPAGQSILGKRFDGGISALGLLAGALLPTLIVLGCFVVFR
jgi:hypothetical protein